MWSSARGCPQAAGEPVANSVCFLNDTSCQEGIWALAVSVSHLTPQVDGAGQHPRRWAGAEGGSLASVEVSLELSLQSRRISQPLGGKPCVRESWRLLGSMTAVFFFLLIIRYQNIHICTGLFLYSKQPCSSVLRRRPWLLLCGQPTVRGQWPSIFPDWIQSFPLPPFSSYQPWKLWAFNLYCK